jgi:hypothetical protein
MTITDEVEREALPTVRGFPHVVSRPDTARLIASLDQSSAPFEPNSLRHASKCREVLLRGILHKQGQDDFKELWCDGVGILEIMAGWQFFAKIDPSLVIHHPYGFAAMAKVVPIYTSSLMSLAAAWLAPRSPDEPRGVLYERIAALRPVEQNKQLQELMEKNNEGTITPAEYVELVRLNEFFDTLQAIIDDAITSTHQKVS